MLIFGIVLLLAFLFYTLAKSADVLVAHVRLIAEQLGINVFFLGLVLGVLTSTPELSIAINSAVNHIPDVSFGNLIGGIPVAIALILGMNAILQRKISTRQGKVHLTLAVPMLILPFLLGLDGVVSSVDSALLMGSYVVFMGISFWENRRGAKTRKRKMSPVLVARSIVFILASLLVILLTSNLIVRFTLELLNFIHVPPFIIGLIGYAIGTDMPEIVISVQAWRSHAQEVSLSNLLGSSFANVLILGILALLEPVPVAVNISYYVMTILVALILIVFAYMYRSGNKLTRQEGFILVGLYLLFVLSQVGGVL